MWQGEWSSDSKAERKRGRVGHREWSRETGAKRVEQRKWGRWWSIKAGVETGAETGVGREVDTLEQRVGQREWLRGS